MTRMKTLKIFLAVVLVVAIVVASVLATGAQSHVTIHIAQEGSSSIKTGTVSPAVPEVLACEGCSGGGTGPF